MPFSNVRAALLAAGVLLAVSACNGTGAVPSSAPAANPDAGDSRAASRIPGRHDIHPETADERRHDRLDRRCGKRRHGSCVPSRSFKTTSKSLKKGQVLVCNFENSSGTAGDGTTIELFDAVANSKPTTFIAKQQD